MVNQLLVFAGAVIAAFAAYRIVAAFFLTESYGGFEQGYLLGNAILLALGLALLIFALKRKRSA